MHELRQTYVGIGSSCVLSDNRNLSGTALHLYHTYNWSQ